MKSTAHHRRGRRERQGEFRRDRVPGGTVFSAVKRRVDRLLASGAITGFSARVDAAVLGWTTEAYVELFCRGRTSPAGVTAGHRAAGYRDRDDGTVGAGNHLHDGRQSSPLEDAGET